MKQLLTPIIYCFLRSGNNPKLDELDKQKALNQLLFKLQEAENSVITEGTISADELEKDWGYRDLARLEYSQIVRRNAE